MSHSAEYTREDFEHGWPDRVYGSETEYTVDLFSNTDPSIKRSFNLKKFNLIQYSDPAHSVATGRDPSTSVITDFGAEVYIDCEVLELATSDVKKPEEIPTQERAGDQFVLTTVHNIANNHPDAHKDISSRVFRRGGHPDIFDADGNRLLSESSIGYHENYYTLNILNDYIWGDPEEDVTYLLTRLDKRAIRDPSAQFLISFLVLRKLIDGAGMVDTNGFTISQKPRAFDFSDFRPNNTHGFKPALWVHPDRLEIRSGERNQSDWATTTKFGLTSLLLRLAEHNVAPNDLVLADPEGALSDISADPFADVMMTNGDVRRGVDVLREMVARAADLADTSNSILLYEEESLVRFDQFCKDLETVSLPDDTIGNLNYVDWSVRFKHFVNNGATHQTMSAKNLSLVALDLMCDRVGNTDLKKMLIASGAIEPKIKRPIATGRALARVTKAKELYEAGNLASVDWDRIIQRTDRGLEALLLPLQLKEDAEAS